MMQDSSRGDDEVRLDLVAVGGAHLPLVIGEHRLGDFAVEPQMRVQLQLADQVAVVTLDLVTGRPHVAPVRLGRERELVAVGRHVAPQAGVAVPMPDAADVRTLFQDGEVGEAGLLQYMSSGDPGHAGADNDDPWIPPLGRAGHGGTVCPPKARRQELGRRRRRPASSSFSGWW